MMQPIDGRWTYRSYRNDPLLVNGDPNRALSIIFGEGVFSLSLTGVAVEGTLDMGGGYVLDITGTYPSASGHAQPHLKMAGVGRPKTPTEGWEYDYDGALAPTWPNGVGQVAAIVGTVIRAKPHDGQPAGYVAGFIAVSG